MIDEPIMAAPSTQSSDHRLAAAWARLDDRARDILIRRSAGQTLEAIGTVHDVSRERVRQVIRNTERALAALADVWWPGWSDRVISSAAIEVVVAEGDLKGIPATGIPDARRALLRQIGLYPSQTWAGRFDDLWSVSATSLDRVLRDLAGQAPFPSDELRERATGLGIPIAVPVEQIIEHPCSPLTRDSRGHWVRRRAEQRDAAYLWLTDEGEPREAARLADAIQATGVHAIEEGMRRDARFRKLQPEGLWALAEWTLPHTSGHGNALDAMIEVLRETAPLTRDELFARTAQRYPVTRSRLQQCLLSDQIGVGSDGRLDLVENGAKPVEESEPRRPPTIAIDPAGLVLGARLTVDKDILRGSGVIVHPWLTWRLGLRLAPTSRTFRLRGTDEILTVRRTTSAAQISALRALVQPMGVTVGCQLALLFRLDDGEADLRHACEPDACHARLARVPPSAAGGARETGSGD
ncbi:sigma factor-like helix-turn-helix DNA-binding protein [Micromonospora sp. NPDC001898]|uniref:sigma factor-like helix-turn-helix DNA-binding protein n=1 Tax=Micromonospora sp. NPDC001898 TaxID=3364221 RepID=UPI0036785E30